MVLEKQQVGLRSSVCSIGARLGQFDGRQKLHSLSLASTSNKGPRQKHQFLPFSGCQDSKRFLINLTPLYLIYQQETFFTEETIRPNDHPRPLFFLRQGTWHLIPCCASRISCNVNSRLSEISGSVISNFLMRVYPMGRYW